MECKLTPAMNDDLMKIFTASEISQALKEMHPTKAPGPDGMPPIFFQKFWPHIGSSVTHAVLNALNTCEFPHDVNHTFITLVPKTKIPQRLKDFRPISLCNVLYKLISKVVANRIKSVLPVVISETQSAFVKGRLITDNVLIAYEVLHFLRRKRKGKKGFISLKLDMSKAYDRVEWSFLEVVMHKLGFHEKFVQLVMKCVTTPSFSILINGSPTGRIIPSRGLRQGDPISPYLFLLCTEGLICLLNEAERNRQVTGIQVSRGAPRLNHLLFADDSLIFCEANEETTSQLQSLLNIYEDALGQQLNKDKTAMVFSNNIRPEQQQALMDLWNAPQVKQYEKYLGLPPMIGRSKSRAFSEIKRRVWQKLQGWKSGMFSQGGREVLLKSVALAIPSYAMSCFKLPPTFCTDIEKMMVRFWWGQKKEERKIHWTSWKSMCSSKSMGGMGFKELEFFNMALLGKQAWRLLQQKDSLVHKIYSARYFSDGNFLKASIGGNPSYAWRGIWEAKNLLIKGGKMGCRRWQYYTYPG